MKIKQGFELRDVCGENVVIAQGIENLDFTHLITLNESAAFLFSSVVGKEFSTQTLADLLAQEYEVTEKKATDDAESLIATWKEQGLICNE